MGALENVFVVCDYELSGVGASRIQGLFSCQQLRPCPQTKWDGWDGWDDFCKTNPSLLIGHKNYRLCDNLSDWLKKHKMIR